MSSAVLITGGARRLGRAIALHLAARGYDIALHYNHSQQEAEATAREIKSLGVGCTLLQADLADPTAYEPLIVNALKAFSHLNALVNNASIFERGNVMEGDRELLARQFRINFEAPVFLTQNFAKHVKQGAVVNMLDTHVTRSGTSHAFYLLSKKSLHEFTLMAARELAPGIRVNGVCPGYILPAEGFGDDYRETLEARLPLKKVASLDDISQAVALLLEVPSLTGQCLFIDGGESLL